MTRCCGCIAAGVLAGVVLAGIALLAAVEILDGQFLGEGY